MDEPQLTPEQEEEILAFLADEAAWAEERLDENGDLIGDFDDFDDEFLDSE